jgi:hypothetical protein
LRFFFCPLLFFSSPPTTKPFYFNTRSSGGITAVIKRRKDYALDNVIQREKKVMLVMRIKELLVRQPGQVMSLKDLGKHKKYIGLTGKRRCIAVLNRFPGISRLCDVRVNSKWFQFTKEAKLDYLGEMRQKEEMEELLVEKLQKLLMMSIDRRIPPKKIGHIRRDLGLPDEFRMNLVKKYPQYMQVVETERFCSGAHSIGSSPGHNCLGNVHTRESGSKEGAGRGAFQETGR